MFGKQFNGFLNNLSHMQENLWENLISFTYVERRKLFMS